MEKSKKNITVTNSGILPSMFKKFFLNLVPHKEGVGLGDLPDPLPGPPLLSPWAPSAGQVGQDLRQLPVLILCHLPTSVREKAAR